MDCIFLYMNCAMLYISIPGRYPKPGANEKQGIALKEKGHRIYPMALIVSHMDRWSFVYVSLWESF